MTVAVDYFNDVDVYLTVPRWVCTLALMPPPPPIQIVPSNPTTSRIFILSEEVWGEAPPCQSCIVYLETVQPLVATMVSLDYEVSPKEIQPKVLYSQFDGLALLHSGELLFPW